MAAGRFVVPPYFPARDRDFNLLSGALLYVYDNETTIKARIYTDVGLSVLSSNPVVANSSGQFPAIYADAGTEAAPVLYSVSVTTSTGASPGNPFNFDNYRPSVDWETAALALAEAAAEAASASAIDAAVSADEAEAAAVITSADLAAIEAIAAGAPDAPSIVNKADRDGSNLTGTQPAEFLAVLNGVSLTALAASTGSGLVGFLQAGTGAVLRTSQSKMRDIVHAADFGFSADNTATENTVALQKAMTYLLDRFPDDVDYYPGGPGDPTDFYDVDRQTGTIIIPAGRNWVSPNVFSSLDHPRAPFCGFVFQGDGKMSSILLLETGGVEAWFYDNGPSDPNKFQQIEWKDIGFRSDDYRYGNVAKVFSAGGPKQFRWTDCDFQYLQKLLYTEGTGNADLTKVTRCTGQFYGDILTLNNDQSLQHDFIGSDLGTYGHFVRVMQFAGGNVSVNEGFIDWIWHEDYSPPGGNFLYFEDANSTVGQGGCTFSWNNCRLEVEAYKRTAGAPPFGLVKTQNVPNTSMPRILFDNCNFANGRTYTIDSGGNITGSDFRRITAADMYPGKHVHFRDCVLLKTFFYNVTGSIDTGSPAYGGILTFTNCFDGVIDELPAADTALDLLAERVTYSGGAGRVITEGMVEHTTGSSTARKLLDADLNWRKSFGREPSTLKKICSFKHLDSGWPFAANDTNDIYLDMPPSPGVFAFKILILMPAAGVITNPYQLHLSITNRAGPLIASSTLAEFKDFHVIELNNTALDGVSRLCLWASGTGTDFRSGGYAFIEYP